jgi:hypothetical protein
MVMKKYTKLPVPTDSAWDRKTWRSYAPYWLRSFYDSIQNVIKWLPIIWKDKHWDDYYITKILQRKIELQREYLVNANRHTGIDRDNKWMTLVLNLIELEHEDFYSTEQYDYQKFDINFIPSESHPDSFEMEKIVEWENLDAYFKKYPSAIRKVKKMHPDKDFEDRGVLAMYVGMYNQKRCRNLIFEILKQKSEMWWD